MLFIVVATLNITYIGRVNLTPIETWAKLYLLKSIIRAYEFTEIMTNSLCFVEVIFCLEFIYTVYLASCMKTVTIIYGWIKQYTLVSVGPKTVWLISMSSMDLFIFSPLKLNFCAQCSRVSIQFISILLKAVYRKICNIIRSSTSIRRKKKCRH